MKKFWMVICEDSPSTSKRHYTYQEAVAEAERLCMKEGKRFILLEAVELCKREHPPVSWENMVRS
jgi:hypothetical protein